MQRDRLVDVLTVSKRRVRQLCLDIPTPSNFFIISLTIGSGCFPSSESCLMICFKLANRSLKGSKNASVYAPVSFMWARICWMISEDPRRGRMTHPHGCDLTICRWCLSTLANSEEEQGQETEDVGDDRVDSVGFRGSWSGAVVA